MPSGQAEIEGSPGRVQPEGVDDSEETPAQAPVHDQVEHLEGVGAGPLVVFRYPDGSPQGVRRHDLLGSEVLRGPMRLPGTGWPDEDHETRGGRRIRRVWRTGP